MTSLWRDKDVIIVSRARWGYKVTVTGAYDYDIAHKTLSSYVRMEIRLLQCNPFDVPGEEGPPHWQVKANAAYNDLEHEGPQVKPQEDLGAGSHPKPTANIMACTGKRLSALLALYERIPPVTAGQVVEQLEDSICQWFETLYHSCGVSIMTERNDRSYHYRLVCFFIFIFKNTVLFRWTESEYQGHAINPGHRQRSY